MNIKIEKWLLFDPILNFYAIFEVSNIENFVANSNYIKRQKLSEYIIDAKESKCKDQKDK